MIIPLVFSFTTLALNLESPIEQIKGSQTTFFEKGGWSSGGGNSVVCFNPDASGEYSDEMRSLLASEDKVIPNWAIQYIKSVEMYDLYTAKLPRGIEGRVPEIVEIKEEEKLSEYVSRIRDRFEGYVTEANFLIKDGQENIRDEDIRFHQNPVKQQNDVGEISLIDKSKCKLTTMAIQRNWGEFHELHIDARLFNHQFHSRLSKATLLLHEYVYSVARKFNHVDSSPTRKLTELLITYDERITIRKVIKTMFNLGFHSYDINDELERYYYFLFSHAGNHIKIKLYNMIYDAYQLKFNYKTEEWEKVLSDIKLAFESIDIKNIHTIEHAEEDLKSLGELSEELEKKRSELLKRFSLLRRDRRNFILDQLRDSSLEFYNTEVVNWNISEDDRWSIFTLMTSTLIFNIADATFKFTSIDGETKLMIDYMNDHKEEATAGMIAKAFQLSSTFIPELNIVIPKS